MLTKKQLEEIRQKISNSNNPVFLYDNDADGFCSYILFKRWLGRGKGVVIRSYPGIDVRYAQKCVELNADLIVILDKPAIGKDFLEEIKQHNLPIIWIDHHKSEKEDYEHLSVYNPLPKSEEPVTYLAHKITNNKDDWIALMGCISDHYLPDFAKSFAKNNPSWLSKVSGPFEAYYSSPIGKLAQSINFGLKDSLSHVVTLQATISSLNSPEELQSELDSSSQFAKHYKKIRTKYLSLLEEAFSLGKERLIFFQYSGELSVSSELANELSFHFPDKTIVVVYTKGGISNLSLRGKGVRKKFEQLAKKIKGLTGGGHEEAVGARIPTDEIESFKKEMLNLL